MDRLQNLGFLLKEVSRRYVARFEAHARSISLTLMQCKVLVHMDRSEGACQARLAEITELEPMTMVRVLNRMEADKLIERRSDPADRRARKLYLTPKARPLLEEIWRLAALVRGEMFDEVPKGDREVFARVLEQANGNLCALERDSALPGEAPGRHHGRAHRAANS
jgi:MarR family transcriptional regulator for hemolysin